MAYIGDDKVLLFGGVDGFFSLFDDTWVYDLSDNAWTQKSPTTKPTARSDHAMAYMGGDKVLLFGGYDGSFDDETWVYDLSDNAWAQKSPTAKPSARISHGMASIGDDKVLLFGGYDGSFVDETWVYSAGTIICPLAKGYWKNNPNAWPAIATPMLLGTNSYTKTQLLTILNTPVGSGGRADASLILAGQLIAAKLNIANGAPAPVPVPDSIASADAAIGSNAIPMSARANTALGRRMTSIAGVLESYNSGVLNTGCPLARVAGGGESEVQSMPTHYALEQNYPNPFNPTTTIQYGLPQDARVTLEVYDVLGRRVTELVNGQVAAGYHEVEFKATSLASGLYFYRMTADGQDGRTFTQIRKLMLLK